ncbi:MAG: hypothetical protein LUP97_00940 [Methanoregula sp.]|nr:hypothetical protein [Methanoregula sp.]
MAVPVTLPNPGADRSRACVPGGAGPGGRNRWWWRRPEPVLSAGGSGPGFAVLSSEARARVAELIFSAFVSCRSLKETAEDLKNDPGRM